MTTDHWAFLTTTPLEPPKNDHSGTAARIEAAQAAQLAWWEPIRKAQDARLRAEARAFNERLVEKYQPEVAAAARLEKAMAERRRIIEEVKMMRQQGE